MDYIGYMLGTTILPITHPASADEDLSYISMKDPGPTVAERIPRYEPTYLTLI